MSYILEACVGNYNEAKKAFALGALRIELCENLTEGGTTPSYGTIMQVKKTLPIPIAVIIRPRGGNFVYSQEEIEIMEADIELCKKIEVESVVFGVLTPENKIDIGKMESLMKIANPLKTVFHMAFDELEDSQEALQILIKLGVDRVLTKGCKTIAIDGLNNLKSLFEMGREKITIVAGGRITKENYLMISKMTGVKELHGKEIVGSLK